MSTNSIIPSSARLNIILLLLIAVNIVNTIYPKGMGYNAEDYVGFGYQLSKYINAATIIVMLPSLFKPIKVFTNMRYMVITIIAYILIASGWGISYNFSAIARSLLVCLSFLFFEETLRHNKINKILLYAYIFSFIFNIAFLVITQDRLGTAVARDGDTHGGQGIAKGLLFILPLLFLVMKDKISAYLYVFCGIVIFISLRRTAILAYFLCLPFIYKRISGQISRKAVIVFILLLAIVIYYIVNNYWFVIEDRFSDMFEASDSGYYGSGRTGWWEILINKYLGNPLHWLFGFGLGSVAKTMEVAGFPWGGAHNDYIEIIFTYGLWGGFLWFSNFGIIFKKSRLTQYKNYKSLLHLAIFPYLFIAFASGGFQTIELICLSLFFNLALNHYNVHEKT